MTIAIIIPTRNRSDLLFELLDSLSKSQLKPDVISICSSGNDIQEILNNDRFGLNIIHKHTLFSGQVLQRKIALENLEKEYDLYFFLDDDFIVSPKLIDEICNFFNSSKIHVAGLGMQIIFKGQKYQNGNGTVTKFGKPLPFYKLKSPTEVFWLPGVSVWRNYVLHEFSFPPMTNEYAAMEDVIFSYAVGQKYKLVYNPSIKIFENPKIERKFNINQYLYLLQHRLYFILINNFSVKLFIFELIYELFKDFIFISRVNKFKKLKLDLFFLIYILLKYKDIKRQNFEPEILIKKHLLNSIHDVLEIDFISLIVQNLKK